MVDGPEHLQVQVVSEVTARKRQRPASTKIFDKAKSNSRPNTKEPGKGHFRSALVRRVVDALGQLCASGTEKTIKIKKAKK